ncbi:MAG: transposase, partial [Acidobacteria bacterium]|nr:transposase [Acidobacteriota bacterium]
MEPELRPLDNRLTQFLAKSIFNCPHIPQLIAELQSNEPLRRFCGYPFRSHIPRESCFSRAFARVAHSELAQNEHEALVRPTQAAAKRTGRSESVVRAFQKERTGRSEAVVRAFQKERTGRSESVV